MNESFKQQLESIHEMIDNATAVKGQKFTDAAQFLHILLAYGKLNCGLIQQTGAIAEESYTNYAESCAALCSHLLNLYLEARDLSKDDYTEILAFVEQIQNKAAAAAELFKHDEPGSMQ